MVELSRSASSLQSGPNALITSSAERKRLLGAMNADLDLLRCYLPSGAKGMFLKRQR